MRVLVIVHGWPPNAQGGAELYARAHAMTLAQRSGDEVLVVTREADASRPEYAVRWKTDEAVRVAWVNNSFGAVRSFEDSYRNPAVARVVAGIVDQFRPDVAHVHHLTCLSTLAIHEIKQRAVPIVFTLHDYWLICHRGQLFDTAMRRCDGPSPSGCGSCLGRAAAHGPAAFAVAGALRRAEVMLPTRLKSWTAAMRARFPRAAGSSALGARETLNRLGHMREVCDLVDRFLSPSEHVRQRFVRFGVPGDRITLYEYGVNHRPFLRVRREPSNILRLGFLGSLMPSKGPDVLLRAFARLAPGAATLDLFGAFVPYHGDERYRHDVEPLLGQGGVKWHGAIPWSDVPRALAAIDVLVVPSVWEENSPFVVREAFLAGAPVVASRIGGLPELVQHERDGLLFEPGSAEALQAALQRLIDEPALVEHLRRRLPVVRSIEDDVSGTRAIYEELIDRARASATPRAASGDADARPRLAAVVLNYGTPDDTSLAVQSLLASRRRLDDVIVVDNDPAGRCLESLGHLARHVTFIRNQTNLGFSGGMNVGIRSALRKSADAVLLVNSDAIVPPDCIGRLEAALTARPTAGIAAPELRSRAFPGVTISRGLSFSASNGRFRHIGFGQTSDESVPPAGWSVVPAASACVWLVGSRVFERAGLLDEDFFFSFEDLEFCLRARRAGFEVGIVGGAVALHEGGASLARGMPARFYFASRNHLMAADRGAPAGSRFAACRRWASIVALNVAHAVVAPEGRMARRLLATTRGAADYFRGRVGPAPHEVAARSPR